MADLIDFIRAEERMKLWTDECRKECECYNCLNMEHEKCKYRCFKNCKKKKNVWKHCKNYLPIQ